MTEVRPLNIRLACGHAWDSATVLHRQVARVYHCPEGKRVAQGYLLARTERDVNNAILYHARLARNVVSAPTRDPKNSNDQSLAHVTEGITC